MTHIRTALACLALAMSCVAIPSSAQTIGVPTCYDTSCKRVKHGQKKYVGADNSVGISVTGEPGVRATMTRTELTPIAVDIPEPPYGVTGSGTCILRFHVSEAGNVHTPAISNCPDAYADTLTASMQSWRYKPLTDEDGLPIPARHATLTVPWKSWQVTVGD